MIKILQKNKFIMALLPATITIAACIIIYKFNVPNPNIVLFVITAYVLSIHGYVNGTISAVIAFIYSLFFFSENHSFHPPSLENCLKKQILKCMRRRVSGRLHKYYNNLRSQIATSKQIVDKTPTDTVGVITFSNIILNTKCRI